MGGCGESPSGSPSVSNGRCMRAYRDRRTTCQMWGLVGAGVVLVAAWGVALGMVSGMLSAQCTTIVLETCQALETPGTPVMSAMSAMSVMSVKRSQTPRWAGTYKGTVIQGLREARGGKRRYLVGEIRWAIDQPSSALRPVRGRGQGQGEVHRDDLVCWDNSFIRVAGVEVGVGVSSTTATRGFTEGRI